MQFSKQFSDDLLGLVNAKEKRLCQLNLFSNTKLLKEREIQNTQLATSEFSKKLKKKIGGCATDLFEISAKMLISQPKVVSKMRKLR